MGVWSSLSLGTKKEAVDPTQGYPLLGVLLVCHNWSVSSTDLTHKRLSLLQQIFYNEFTSIAKQLLAGVDVPRIANSQKQIR